LKLLADGIKADQIFIAGDSAGGNLAISLVLWLREHPEHDMPLGVFVVSPWLDLTFSTASIILNRPWDYLPNFLGDHARVGEDRTQWFLSI
jgi:acetyl esterase/lipase